MIQFSGFSPQLTSFVFAIGLGDNEHSKPMHGFSGLTLTNADSMKEFVATPRIIGFGVIRSDTGSGANKLKYQGP